MSLPNVVAATILITALTLACGGAEETPAPTQQPAPAAQTTAPSAQSSQAAAQTTAPAATEPAEEENQGPQPPPKDELIKFANWDDNPVKLLNWIAAYIIAHGLDRPIRVIDVEDGAYQDPLLANDVDIVIAADGAWADEQSGAGNVVRLTNASPVDASLAVVLHPSMNQRAPDVVRLLETLTIDPELLTKQAAMIRGGQGRVKGKCRRADLPQARVRRLDELGRPGHRRPRQPGHRGRQDRTLPPVHQLRPRPHGQRGLPLLQGRPHQDLRQQVDAVREPPLYRCGERGESRESRKQ